MSATLKARFYTADGKAGKKRELPSDPFDGVIHEESIYAAVKAYLANQRQGTASAKTRSTITGGGRKPWRQKGTGRARHGSIRSPIWRGGSVIFPPLPRSYREELPKKVRRLARRSAFNARASEDRVLLVEDLEIEEPKTKRIVKLLQQLEVAEENVLLLTAGHRRTVYLSARNIPNVEIRAYGTESAYDVLRADVVLIEAGAFERTVAPEGPAEADAETDEQGENGERGEGAAKATKTGAKAESSTDDDAGADAGEPKEADADEATDA